MIDREENVGSTKRQAVVICTRNRPDDLRRTLDSIAEHDECGDLLVVIVDASDDRPARQNEQYADDLRAFPVLYLSYPGRPAGTRQRNFGVCHLPDAVEIVHFIDDDVTVLPGYFQRLADTLRRHPEIGGVGGVVREPGRASRSGGQSERLKRLFFLSSARPGSVLPSGIATPAQEGSLSTLIATQWLNGCSSYRREVLNDFRFDATVEGDSPRLEDLDFSYRVAQVWPLWVQPKAQLIHHVSPLNRYDTERVAYERVVRRYWFVEKNIRHPLRKPAFWWSVVGQVLAVKFSKKPTARDALRGVLRGIRAILRCDHPLLRKRGRGTGTEREDLGSTS